MFLEIMAKLTKEEDQINLLENNKSNDWRRINQTI
jgi:hypothetical protein